MRKLFYIVIFICFSVTVILFIFSCKHEIIYPSNYGYTGTPYVPQNPPPPPSGKPCNPDSVYYDNQIQPILTSNCTMCHNASGGEENFSLTSYSAVMYSGLISPGNPNGSKMYNAITASGGGEENDRMPPSPRSPLTSSQINLIYKWISQGAKYLTCGSCDTNNFTFSGAVFPVIQNNCLGCHTGSGAGGGVSLANYNDINAEVNNGKLICTITWSSGCNAMPKGGYKLSDCIIKQFQKWIKNGHPNN